MRQAHHNLDNDHSSCRKKNQKHHHHVTHSYGPDSSSDTTVTAAVRTDYSNRCSVSSPLSRSTTTTLVLSLLFLVVGITIVNNNQLANYEKLNVNNGVMGDATGGANDESHDNNLHSRRRRDSSGTTSTTTATLLTRTTQLSSLLSNLDASDVIECYIVTRMANLANVETYSSSLSGKGGGGNGNTRRNIQAIGKDDDTSTSTSSIPTGPILIRKAALAFRYRPKVASVTHVTPSSTNDPLPPPPSSSDSTEQQKYFELTLEYGPQRAGATKASESMPLVHVDMEVMSNYNEDGNDDVSNNNIGKYVSWDNQGSIYYSTHISNEWSGAYYMAPITGVVLEKILEKAVEYPNKRPRYQPFEVVSIPSNNIILKSSGSDDFVWDMLRDLADLYVDIDPIVVPPRGKVQLFVADPVSVDEEDEDSSVGGTRSQEEMRRRRPNPNVQRVEGAIESSKAALFYENFFNCANAKKTGDYSMFLPMVTSAPSPAPPVDEGYNSLSNTTLGASKANKADEIADTNGDGSHRSLDGASNSNNTSSTQSELNVDEEEGLKGNGNSTDSSPSAESDNVGEGTETPAITGAAVKTGEDKDNSLSSIDDEESELLEPNEFIVDSEDDGDAAKAAEKAAIEAAQKAKTAAAVAATNSSSPEDSAKAASEAAIAAKKAADASVASRAKASAEGLLSGDGATMTSILSSCFSDPKYGIRKNHAEMTSTTYAYVYLDGDVFIRLNLTAPYWGPATVVQTVPPPHAHVEGQGDVVDWAIFILLMGGAIFGFLVMAHQLGVSIDNRLRFRYVFHPLADDDSVELERLEKGGGTPHSIGIDAIPVSLGGKLSHYNDSKKNGPPTTYKDRLSDSSIGDESNGLLDIELTNREKNESSSSPKRLSQATSGLPISLRLKEEAPDLVERPTLKSMSKVALPPSSPPRDEHNRAMPSAKKTNLPEIPNMM